MIEDKNRGALDSHGGVYVSSQRIGVDRARSNQSGNNGGVVLGVGSRTTVARDVTLLDYSIMDGISICDLERYCKPLAQHNCGRTLYDSQHLAYNSAL